MKGVIINSTTVAMETWFSGDEWHLDLFEESLSSKIEVKTHFQTRWRIQQSKCQCESYYAQAFILILGMIDEIVTV